MTTVQPLLTIGTKEATVMKKYIWLISCVILAACSKEMADDSGSVSGHYSITVKAAKVKTKALTLTGSTITTTWEEGDEVSVYNGASLLGTITAQNTGANTTLKGELDGEISTNDVLTLKFLSPSYSTQDGTLTGNATSIDKVCDYAEATITVKSKSDNKITIKESTANFSNHQAIVKFTLKDKNNGDAAISASRLTVRDGTNIYTITPASATSVYYVAIPGFSGKPVSLTARVDDDVYTYKKTGVSFTNGTYYEIAVSMSLQGYVDLGLPSGTAWATCNLGAVDPEDYGDHFAWGATETWYTSLGASPTWKSGKEAGYVTANAPYYNNGTWTKYNLNSTLEAMDDAAYANWGSNWHTPTSEQWNELKTYCTFTWTQKQGVNGALVLGPSGNEIFLPAAGIFGTSLGRVGEQGLYFTATQGNYANDSQYVLYYQFQASNSGQGTVYDTGRYFGMSIRPVKNSTKTFNYTGAVQTFTVPANGYYTLTCYGAQGGTFTSNHGGYGGTSQLTYQLTQGDVLYLYVGGQGGSIAESKGLPDGGNGGWNGGGKGGTGVKWHQEESEIPWSGGGGGGGATHIATSAIGPITKSTDFTSNHTSLLLIAGGGGGGCSKGEGGNAGGATGEKGFHIDNSYIWSIPWNNGTCSCGKDGMLSSWEDHSCEGCGGGGGGYLGGNTWVVQYNKPHQCYSGAGGSSWGDETNGEGYFTTPGGATAGGNGKAVITWYGTTYPAS